VSGPGPIALLALLAGAALLLAGLYHLVRGPRRAPGRYVALDRTDRPAPLLRSERWRLSGRPDAIVELADGRWIPVELKSRAAPHREPPASHRVQIAAYALLVEEATGRAPPFGILRYGDGTEYRIPWDDATRDRLWRLRTELDRPYDGRASPSPGRCRGCRFRSVCDRSVA
jgi:CRISPR-associated exonuclease Cas4